MTSVSFMAQCLTHYTHSLNIKCYFYLDDSCHGEYPGGESTKGNGLTNL